MSHSQVELDKIRVARELREIRRLYGHLEQHAADSRSSHRDASENDALLALAPAANLDDWHETYAAAQDAAFSHPAGVDPKWNKRNGGKDYEADQVEENHALLVLADYEDKIRALLGTPTQRRATVHDAATYLASATTWMFDDDLYGNPNYAHTDQLIKDLTKVRVRLESILKDGIRHEKTETPSDRPGCAKNLVKVYRDSAAHDFYKCPNKTHDQHITHKEFVAITKLHMWSAAADHVWVSVSDAATATERTSKTIMSWLYPKPKTEVPFDGGSKVEYRRVGPMRRIEVKWDDVRTVHDATKRRNRAKKIA